MVAVDDRRKSGLKRELKSAIMMVTDCFSRPPGWPLEGRESFFWLISSERLAVAPRRLHYLTYFPASWWSCRCEDWKTPPEGYPQVGRKSDCSERLLHRWMYVGRTVLLESGRIKLYEWVILHDISQLHPIPNPRSPNLIFDNTIVFFI